MSPDLHPHISHKISGIVQKGNTGISAFTSQSHIFAGTELVQIWVPEWLVSLVVNQRHRGHRVNPQLTSVVVLSPHNHLILLCISLALGSTVLLYFGFLNHIAYLPKSLSHCLIVALFHFSLVLWNFLISGYLYHALSNCPENHLILISLACMSMGTDKERQYQSVCCCTGV